VFLAETSQRQIRRAGTPVAPFGGILPPQCALAVVAAATLSACALSGQQGTFELVGRATDAISVATPTDLASALAAAAPGTDIVLVDGTYANAAFALTGRHGTAAQPITIEAATVGAAVIAGTASFRITGSSYVKIRGLKFVNQGTAVTIDGSDHVELTQNRFQLAAEATAHQWVALNGALSTDTFIHHNEFGPRQDLGQMIALEGPTSPPQVAQRTLIECNYFHDAAPQTMNGGETIRIGLSTLQRSSGYNTVQYNVFENCDSDAEVVSTKSSNNLVAFNTFRNNAAQVTARHGDSNTYRGNFFLGDGVKAGVGGFRIYCADQKIYDNYFEKLTGTALDIAGAEYDPGPTSATFTAADMALHWRVYRALVTNNTLVDSGPLVIGGGHPIPPADSRVANNIVVGTAGPLYDETLTTNTVFEGNFGYGATLDNVSRTSAEVRDVNPSLVTVAGMQKLSMTSPAIDSSVGTYAFVVDDMDGQPRDVDGVLDVIARKQDQ
jgi:poly(beta-D-mannuronate) lyase